MAESVKSLISAPGFRPVLRSDLRYYAADNPEIVIVHDLDRDRRFQLYQIECEIAKRMDGTRDLDGVTEAAQSVVSWATREHIEKLAVQLGGMGLLQNVSAPHSDAGNSSGDAASPAPPKKVVAAPSKPFGSALSAGSLKPLPSLDKKPPPLSASAAPSAPFPSAPSAPAASAPQAAAEESPVEQAPAEAPPAEAPPAEAPPAAVEDVPEEPPIEASGEVFAPPRPEPPRDDSPSVDTQHLVPLEEDDGGADTVVDADGSLAAQAMEALREEEFDPRVPFEPGDDDVTVVAPAEEHRRRSNGRVSTHSFAGVPVPVPPEAFPHHTPVSSMPAVPPGNPSGGIPTPAPPGAEALSQPLPVPWQPHPTMPPPMGPPTGPMSAQMPVAPASGPISSPMGVPYTGPIPRQSEPRQPPWYRKRSTQLLAIPAVLLVAALVLALIPTSLEVSAECVIEPAETSVVRTPVDGILSEVLAKEGQEVAAGAPLARLDDRKLTYDLEKTKTELDALKAKLAKLKAAPAPQQAGTADSPRVKSARAKVEAASNRVRAAQREVSRISSELNSDKPTPKWAGGVSADDLRAARRHLASRRSALSQARSELSAALAADKPKQAVAGGDVTVIEADIRRLEVEAQYLEKQMKLQVIKSPIGGRVLTRDFSKQVNKKLAAGDAVVEVGDARKVKVVVKVPADRAKLVEIGQPIRIELHSSTKGPFAAQVGSIAPDEKGDGSIRVEATLDNPQGLLDPPLSGVAVIDAGSRSVLGKIWHGITD